MRHRTRFTVAAVVLAVVAGLAVPGQAAEQQQVANIDRSAYFTRPATAATPPLLLDGFPPGTACLVAGLAGVPELCGEQIKDVTGQLGLGDGIPVPETIDADLVQPVAPGTTPVGMLAGQERYVSLLRFALPELPPDERFASLELRMRAEGLNYAIESPAFREAVLAAISQISEADPARFADLVADVAAGDVDVISESVTGIEACPATEEWDGGDAQNAGLRGTRLPDVDCLIGTTGDFDAATGTWVFDLTFAAQAWTGGAIDGEVVPNEGVVLRPLGAENLAYGDPDLSTNWLVSLADEDAPEDLRPRLRYTTVTEASPVESAPVEVAVPPAAGPVGSVTGPVSPPAPAVAPQPATRAVVPGAISARYAERAASSTDASTPWWLVLFLPIVLGGAWALGESVFAAPAVAGDRRGGALEQLTRASDPTGGNRS